MSKLREVAYQIDPARWVEDVVGVTPAAWQKKFLRAPRGASIAVLTARQVGKTTTAAFAIAHFMLYSPGSLNVIVCPAQRQSAEAVRRVKECLLKAGATLKSDNVYGIELDNGSRVLALPGAAESIRGLTVDGWIIADEAAYLTSDLIPAVSPMRARRPDARFALLSTAWSRTDPFWTAWTNDDQDMIRIKVTVDEPDCPLPQEHVARERKALPEADFKREYLGIPAGSHTSPFTWELYDRATHIFTPEMAAQLAGYRQYGFHPEDPTTWPKFSPLIIAHDVARSNDRSTAVIGGCSPFPPSLSGIAWGDELPRGKYGRALANELAEIDRKFGCRALIIADITRDDSYAEILYEMFGRRLIGLHISRSGEGSQQIMRPVQNGAVPIFTLGRTYLFDLLLSELQANQVRLSQDAELKRGFDQLTKLEVEYRQTGKVYGCPVGQHDDLAISLAMLAWAAQHPRLTFWARATEQRPRPKRPPFNWAAVT
jgi:Terminase large subunit, T4likevirus-type, N-terminal